jgi:hypothetical protein
MKRIAIALAVVAVAIPVLACQHRLRSGTGAVKRGAPIEAGTKNVTLTELLETPGAYGSDPVVVEGVVSKVCMFRGCWMDLSAEAGQPGVRVTFEGFTVPRDSKRMRARLVGVARVRTEKGTSRVSFVASGAELWQ